MEVNTMKLKTPKAVIHGHANLMMELNEVIAIGGIIGEKAKQLREEMTPHFKKEEEYALPPLGLLLAFSEENWEINSEEAIKMADNLKLRLNEMKDDHANIKSVMKELKLMGEEKNNFIVKMFIRSLVQHLELEDEVLYPATILVGNYLKKISQA